jgi:thiol-disulfide isomerase/thioredoxin
VTGTIVLIAAVALAMAVGAVYKAKSGSVRRGADVGSPQRAALIAAGVPAEQPAVLHFSAPWCGPCGAVRRVVENTLREFPDVADVELDIDENPQLSKLLGVLSLPTTFVLDADLQQSRRIAGVPRPEDLRAALASVSRPEG